MTLDWSKRSYAKCGLDLGVAGLQPSDKSQHAVPGAGARVVEEVLETFVMLHLEELTGLPLHFVSRSYEDSFVGGEDLIAWDALGRVHLFELKSGRGSQTVNRGTVEQLTQYTMKHLFRPATEFVEQEWRTGNEIWSEPILAGYLAGAYLGERVLKFGYDQVKEFLITDDGEWDASLDWEPSATKPSQNWWKGRRKSLPNAGPGEKSRFRFQAAVARAESQLGCCGFFRSAARMWRKEYARMRRPPLPKFRPQRPAVMWFIAPNTRAGHTAMVEWRAKGVDARAVEVDLRRVPSDDVFQVSWRREKYSARDAIEAQLFARPDAAAGSPLHPPRLALEYYSTKQSSGRQKEEHGLPLDAPRARVEKIESPNWIDLPEPGGGTLEFESSP